MYVLLCFNDIAPQMPQAGEVLRLRKYEGVIAKRDIISG